MGLCCSIREKADVNDSVCVSLKKTLVNFSEDCSAFVCCGRRCYVIESKTLDELTVKEDTPILSAAKKALFVVLTLLAIPFLVCLAIKLIHRCCVLHGRTLLVAASSVIIPPSEPIIPSPEPLPIVKPPLSQKSEPKPKKNLAPLKFGSAAFTVYTAPKIQKTNSLSEGDINKILSKYSSCGFSLNPMKSKPHSVSKEPIQSLILKSYSFGLPNYPAYKEMVTDTLSLIFSALADTKHSAAKRQAIAKKLAEGFTGCQVMQVNALQSLTSDLMNVDDLSVAIQVFFQEYKMQKLDEFVMLRHPNCQRSDINRAKEEFPHIRSAYIAALGHNCGLTEIDIAAAQADVNKASIDTTGLRDAFRKFIDLDEFARNIAADINSPNEEISKITKGLIDKWGKDREIVGFGYHKEGVDYSDLPKPTSDQETLMKPYISLTEARSILLYLDIAK